MLATRIVLCVKVGFSLPPCSPQRPSARDFSGLCSSVLKASSGKNQSPAIMEINSENTQTIRKHSTVDYRLIHCSRPFLYRSGRAHRTTLVTIHKYH
ncbi:hypothetical protein B9Z19DRAFT_1079604 [Tuber borchii]|uniref:Uncharacterized protein n=1 Tax=Tuber borchii TaxID=42251 RepID=A0A2T6ZY54_TUBBO|nr:hypothetical protein B9Z19DRAFT_1079604 [Tuber borchii]